MLRLAKYTPHEVLVVHRLAHSSILRFLLDMNSANLLSYMSFSLQGNVISCNKVRWLLFVWWSLCSLWLVRPSRQFCHPFVLRVSLPGPTLFSSELILFLSAQGSSLQIWSSPLMSSGSLAAPFEICSVPCTVGFESDAIVFVCCVLRELGMRLCWEKFGPAAKKKKPLARLLLLTTLGEGPVSSSSRGSGSKSGVVPFGVPKIVFRTLGVGQWLSQSVKKTDVFVCCYVGRFVPFPQSSQSPVLLSSLDFRQILSALHSFISAPLAPELAITSKTEPVPVRVSAANTDGEAELAGHVCDRGRSASGGSAVGCEVGCEAG